MLKALPNLEKVSMYLPFGFMDTHHYFGNRGVIKQPFGKIGIGTESLDEIFDTDKTENKKNKVKERSSLPTLISTDSLKTISELRDRDARPTVLEVGRSKGRRYSRIIQRFPAKVCDGTVKRRSGFYYWWNTREVLISKTLGTTKYKKVALQTEMLMKECSRFYLIHCDVITNKSR